MKTVVTITTPPLEWSRQKLVEMRRDILLFLAQQCAPNAKWVEVQVGVEALAGDSDKKRPDGDVLTRFKCKSCPNSVWYSDKFRPCPSCNQRVTVAKAKIKRELPPKGSVILTS